MTWDEITQGVTRKAASLGLDIVQPFRVGDYNDVAPDGFKLPVFSGDSLPDPGAQLGLLVGNTKHLWPVFIRHLNERHGRGQTWHITDLPGQQGQFPEHPLQEYVEQTVPQLAAEAEAAGVKCHVRYSHHGGDRKVAMQLLCERAGLAAKAKGGLCVHPVYGPWFGLRAALVFNVPGPASPAVCPPA